MTTFAVPCDKCGVRIKVRADKVGKRVRCPKCQQVFVVPPQAIPAASVCPDCQKALPPEAKICVDCGFDLRTGTKLQTVIEKKKKQSKKTENHALLEEPIAEGLADRRVEERRSEQQDTYTVLPSASSPHVEKRAGKPSYHCPFCNAEMSAGNNYCLACGLDSRSKPQAFNAWLAVSPAWMPGGGSLQFHQPVLVLLGTRLMVEASDASDAPPTRFIDELLKRFKAGEIRKHRLGKLILRHLLRSLLGAFMFSSGLAMAGVLSLFLPLGIPPAVWFLVAILAFPFVALFQMLLGLPGCFRRRNEIVLQRRDGDPLSLWADDGQVDDAVQSLRCAGIPTCVADE